MVLKEMEELKDTTSRATRFGLAKKVFEITHRYDGVISDHPETVEI